MHSCSVGRTLMDKSLISGKNATWATKHHAVDRVLYVDVIRAYAISLVVLLHISHRIEDHFLTIDRSWWWIGTLTTSLCRPGVPLFIMLSGMLLLSVERNEKTLVFFHKRLVKIVLPFLAWGMIYLFVPVNAYFRDHSFSWTQVISLVIKGPIYFHLWFIYVIIGLYLCTPILRVYVRHANRKNLAYFLFLWFFWTSVLPVLNRFFNLPVGIHIPVVTGYVGYFVLGFFLGSIHVSKKQAIVLFFLIIGCIVFTALGSYSLTSNGNGTFDTFFCHSFSPNVIIGAVCIFLFFKAFSYDRVFRRFPTTLKVVTYISSASYSIYLLHVIVYEEFGSTRLGFTLNAWAIHPLIGIPATFLVTMLTCFLVISVLRKIPYIRAIVSQ